MRQNNVYLKFRYDQYEENNKSISLIKTEAKFRISCRLINPTVYFEKLPSQVYSRSQEQSNTRNSISVIYHVIRPKEQHDSTRAAECLIKFL